MIWSHFLQVLVLPGKFPSLCLKVDANKDRLVSLEEFLKSTEKKDFNNPKEWEVRDPEVAGFGSGPILITDCSAVWRLWT